jgi:hypothetical protein
MVQHCALRFRAVASRDRDGHPARAGEHLVRKMDEQKKAALQQRIAALKEKVRRIERREATEERRARAHVGIVVGWGMIEHALRNPDSEVRRVAIRLIETHLHERPDDHPVAELLTRLNVPAALSEAAE